jgi:hypothetical protein
MAKVRTTLTIDQDVLELVLNADFPIFTPAQFAAKLRAPTASN